ncbi:MAG TPA: tripartite tricarboxylate transporter substrate binding protein [Burkholderiaceae bacterium]|jgi:tripartite-type tricarboxylate transporter receptor subunit TctC
MTTNIIRRSVLLGSMAMAVSLGATAQPPYPSHPVRLIVPYAPGGSTDGVARIIGRAAEDLMKQSVVIDNRPGANTIVGTDFVARSKADGYTLILATNPHTSNPSLYASVPYDAEKDFSPIVYVGATPNVIAVNPKTGLKSLKALIEMAKATPGKLDFATAGLGSVQHLSGAMLGLQAGVKFQHIPYKGGGPASADVLAGQVPILISGLAAAMPFIKSNTLTALAVTSANRAAVLPDVPTVAESGFPGFESNYWFEVLAPRATPRAVVDELNRVFNAVLQLPAVRQQMADLGVDVTGGTVQQAEEFLKDDTQKMSRLVKATGIKLVE